MRGVGIAPLIGTGLVMPFFLFAMWVALEWAEMEADVETASVQG
ncbi:MAG TPA: hypothetical protein VJS30_01040 [Paraburkholderia sp.]|nr:hypothetical protein [Paraburkholderia sp.]